MRLKHDCCQESPTAMRDSAVGASHIDQLVAKRHSARLPTIFGEFTATVYGDDEGREHVVLQMGEIAGEPPVVRVHSECLTGDVLGSVRCDCREQLIMSLRRISAEGRGLLVYLRQEGRGIGLANKIHAYHLQDQGLDTVDANLHLGFPADSRSFLMAAAMLRDLGVTHVRLLTNNPQKVSDLELGQIIVTERILQYIAPRPENQRYLQTKADKLGHMLDELMGGIAPDVGPESDNGCGG